MGNVPFSEAVAVWWRIGFLSFGGPAGQIALMHRILVEEKRWIDDARFLHALNYCMVLPGPEAQQLATYVGWLLHGVRGGLVAGVLFILPGAVIILALSWIYVLFGTVGVLEGLFLGLKAAVLAIVVQALIRIGRRTLGGILKPLLALAAFVALFFFGVPFPVVVLSAGVIGYIGAEWFTPRTEGEVAAEVHEVTVRPGTRRAAAVAFALWVACVGGLALILGGESVYTQIAVFFSKMAVVTVGGAYAVLAYVAQQGVEHYQWLQPGEMLDGLALAETTPGPLILVTQFVGFLAAYRAGGVEPSLLAATLGAGLTTLVTFLPCFVWIFAGAPYAEKLRGHRALAGSLAAITAAVVGVIANLALWFGLAVVVDIPMLLLSVIAFVLVFALKVRILPALLICGLLGVIWVHFA